MDAAASVASAARHYRSLPGPRPIPVLGNLHQIDKMAMHASLEAMAQRYGPVFPLKMGRTWIAVASDAQDVRHLLRDRPDAVRRSPWASGIMNELGLTGVFTAEGEDWRRQRLLMTRAFTAELVTRFYPTMTAMIDRLVARWDTALAQGRTIDVARDLKAWAMDVAVAFAMGEDVHALDAGGAPLQRDIDFIFNQIGRRSTKPFPYWRRVRLPVDRAADAAARGVREAVQGFIAHARSAAAPGVQGSNLLQSMLAARDAPGSGFTDEMLIGNAATIVFAGEDTTAASIAWTLVELAAHPELIAAVTVEARALDGDAAAPAYEALHTVPRLAALLNETQRLRPAAPLLPMGALRDLQLGEVLIPAGTRVVLLTRRAWLTSGEFTDARRFDVERWGADGGEGNASETNRHMFPFGGGPRFCPGRHLALVEMKALMLALLRRFELAPADGDVEVRERLAVTMNPDRIPLRLKKRRLSA